LDQDVTLDLVPDLTAEDLVEIGVSSIGHRRRLLTAAKAVQALLDAPPEAAKPEPHSATEVEPEPNCRVSRIDHRDPWPL